MKFDFEVVNRPDAHHHAADAMSCLHRASLVEENESKAEIEDDVPTLCILRKISDVENVLQEKRPTPLDVPNAAKLRGVQQTNAFPHHAPRLIGTSPRFAV